MSNQANDELSKMTNEIALKEYKLAVQTQMHFNEILKNLQHYSFLLCVGYGVTEKSFC